MILRQQFSLMRLGILCLLMAVFSAFFLAPINARSTHRALYNDANLTSRLMTPHAGQIGTSSAEFLAASMGLPNPTEIKLTASDGASFDQFGESVSISGDVAVIGATPDDYSPELGSAYIYRWNGSTWQEEAKLLPSDGAEYGHFGYSVSVSGNLALIGAYADDDNGADSGSAYIFRFDGTAWQQEAKLLADDGAADDNFGRAVSIGDDVAIVGASYDDDNGSSSGAAYILRFDGTAWQQESKLTASDGASSDYFGTSVSLDGETAIIGAYRGDGNSSSSGSAYIYRFDGTAWQEESKLTASDGAQYDYFGASVSLDGTVALIGAYRGDGNSSSSGSAYIFRFDGTAWQQETKLTASDGASSDFFGRSVSVEGTVALIGARGDDDHGSSSGSAYIYRFDGTNWQESAKLTAGDGAESDYFGTSVSVSGEMALVGAPQDNDNINLLYVGAAYLYDLSPGNVPDITLSPSSIMSLAIEGASSSTETLTIANRGTDALVWNISGADEPWLTVKPLSGTLAADEEGLMTLEFNPIALPIGHYTETLTISSNDPDEAELTVPLLFKVMRRTTQLNLRASDGEPNDYFGWTVSLSGDMALIGALEGGDNSLYSGAAYLYRFDGTRWAEEAKLRPNDGSSEDYFGNSVSLSGDIALVGALGANNYEGAAYIFRWNGNQWQQETKLLPPDGNDFDAFGASVSLDGDLALIGSSSAAYVFRWDGSEWQQEATLETSDGSSEYYVSLSGDVAIVGGDYNTYPSASGSAYIFRFNGNTWQEEQKLVASDGTFGFGWSVSISGDVAIVGTYASQGAAYIYRFNGSSWVEEAVLVADGPSLSDYFGFSVSVRGNLALVSVPGYDNNDGTSGATFLFRFNGSDWQDEAILTSGTGHSVSLSDNLALVGIPFDDSSNGSASLYNLSPGDVPDIEVEPTSLSATLIAGESLTETLTIGNGGFQTLTWQLEEVADWLSVMPISGTLAPNEEQTLTILFDGTNLTAGSYAATVSISSNDPDESIIEVPVLLRVMPSESKLLASDGAEGDDFGRAVSISGDLAVIGAPDDDDKGDDSGSAYIYRWNGSSWQEEAKLTASDGSSDDQFGYAVSIHDEMVIIGAYYDDDHGSSSGSAYIFRFDGSSWQQEAKLLADDGVASDYFGSSVSISHHALTGHDYAIVGADGDDDHGSYSGAAYIFRFDGTAWQQESKLTASDGAGGDYFGKSVSLDGETAIIGAYQDDDLGYSSGSAYIYRFDGDSWQEEGKLTASDGASYDNFGYSVSVSGNVALVGASGDDDNGSSSGSTYSYRFDGSSWLQESKLTASDGAESDYFGRAVSLEGNMAIIGANRDGYSSGSAYLFEWDGTGWQEELKLLASDGASSDYFGYSVALSGDRFLVGAYGDDDLGSNSGAGYIYQPQALELKKSAQPASVLAGGVLTYTLAAINNTPETLTGVTISDVLPLNTTDVEGSASHGGSQTGGVVTFPPVTINSGQRISRTFQVQVNPALTFKRLFSDDFEDGLLSARSLDNWVMSGLWNAESESDACGAQRAPFPSSSHAAYFGIDSSCTYSTTGAATGTLTMLNPVLLTSSSPYLSFWSYEETECAGNCSLDKRYVELSTDGGSSWNSLGEVGREGLWYQATFSLSSYAGQSILIRFRFDSRNDYANNYFGWMVDNIELIEQWQIANTACLRANEGDADCDTRKSWVNNPAVIELTKTVGTDPTTCATTESIMLPPEGGEVTYCYKVENTGLITLTEHNLVDDQLGTLLSDHPFTLTPGTSTWLTATTQITVPTVNHATWIASDGIRTATSTDSATVNVMVPEIKLTKTVGTDASFCAGTDKIGLPSESGNVTYCYSIENTGDVTFTQHSLVDDQLGTLLSDFPLSLSPGASYWLTETVNITPPIVNHATWTASDGVHTVMASDTATVTLPVVQVTTDSASDYDPAISQAADGTLWAAWRSGSHIWYKTSSDNGTTWSEPTQLTDSGNNYNPAITQAADGTLWVVWESYQSGNYDIWYKTSSDGGATWSADTQLTTDSSSDGNPAIMQSADGILWVVWQSRRSGNRDIWYKTSSDNESTWSAASQLTTNSSHDYNPTIAQAADGRLMIVWERSGQLRHRTSSDGGATWEAEAQIDGNCCYENPALTVADDGTLWLFSQASSDIWYQTSSDHGVTWSSATRFSYSIRSDDSPSVAALLNGRVGVVWTSNRSGNTDIWFGIPGEREDSNPPPYVSSISHLPAPYPDSVSPITFRAQVLDESGVNSAEVVWTLDDVPQTDLLMYDDGAHGDDSAGDGIYGVQHSPLPASSQVSYQVRATDIGGNSYLYPSSRTFEVLEAFTRTANILFVADYGGNSTSSFAPYFTNALNALGYDYDVWDTALRGKPNDILNLYQDGAIIWAAPYWGYFYNSDVRSAIQAYLDAGGKLFITGQDVASYLNGSTLLSDYLHATYVQDDTNLYQLNGTAGDPIGDGLTLSISGGDGANNQSNPDEIDPIAPAVTLLTYDPAAVTPLAEPLTATLTTEDEAANEPLDDFSLPPRHEKEAQADKLTPQVEVTSGQASSTGTGAVRVDTGTYRAVLFSFGFEAINSAHDRALVMERVLSWFGITPTWPDIELSPDSYQVTLAQGDYMTESLTISNVGSDTLNWNAGTLTDDFDPEIEMSQWTAISGATASTSCGSVEGNALYFDGNAERQATSNPLVIPNGRTIEFYLKIGTEATPCENADPGDELLLQYSTDNGASWMTLNSYDVDAYSDFTLIVEQIPTSAQTTNTLLRWIQPSHGGSGFDNWAIDNVTVAGNLGEFVSLEPISGTLAVGEGQTVTLGIDATLLTGGTYTETLSIFSNDPDQPQIEVPITLTVTSLTPTPTHTPTSTPTSTATSTPTATGTAISTPTATGTAISTPTATGTLISTPTATGTLISTPTATGTAISTPTATGTLISTPTGTAISTPTGLPTGTSTATATGIPTSTPTATPTATPTVVAMTTAMIDASGGTLISPDSTVLLDFPAGAVKEEITVIYTELITSSTNTGSLRFAGLSFDISAFDSQGNPITQFLQPLTMSITYQDGDWQEAGIEDTRYLNLYWRDGQNWLGLLPCNGCEHDLENNRLTIMLDHLSEFALLADDEAPSRRIYLPVIRR